MHPQHYAFVLLLGTDAMAAVSDHCLFLQLFWIWSRSHGMGRAVGLA